jgi:hydrogenase maturation protease
MTTIIIGMGNPVLCDDSVGLKIAGRLRDELLELNGVAVTELYSGGINLMEAMIGYDRAIVIDAIQSGDKPGTIRRMAIDDVQQTRNTCSTHDASLAVSLDLGKIAGLPLPQDIGIWAVEAQDVETFSEHLTEDVERAVPVVAEKIIQDLRQNNGLSSRRR